MDDKGSIGEKFVNELSYNSFLKYWCYPSPKFENGNKKEICDLLIIFNSIAIIISVKNYEYKGNHFRYFNNTIEKAVKQLHGACRILFGTNEVHIKHPDKAVEIFPKNEINKIFRIVINLGEGVKFYPFNQLTKNDDYVTLFDKNSFEAIINELDTIPDFIDYLEKREKLFKGKTTIILPGEEDDFSVETQKEFFQLSDSLNSNYILISGTEKDLLAHYFKNTRNFPDVLNEDVNGSYLIIDGDWNDFAAHEKVKRKDEADKISYFIDQFVLNELLVNINPMRENLAKALLSFDRLTRRIISKSYFEFYDRYKDVKGLHFGRRFGDFNGIGILFTFYTNEMHFEMVHVLNQLAIESSNLYTNYKSKSMILISSNSEHRFLFHYIEKLERYSESLETDIRKDIETMGWFTKHTQINETEKEFPEE
ncbi:hypothetical protein K5L04_01565 [Flavobacterium psychrophilum]|uniref:hypothetical protein n=1 Tax=Flavobacterium psychrophilum TaxID=96345 RepID=UPI001C8FA1D5|nr:hypothetical protein [Flavobacterium psychrophilum]EKT4548791.1 hypothetical protein [Flavobacterium psychrophilum]ELM3649693.1 hypothetical protein [Flavobacterium psychrophilum]ELM3671009.1 hypothetical protein [Flavobacterium psychrophilum]ELM3725523.1 hypothetical protein [Flavobacterium psychrophilum]QZK97783.1 hypothetical protein K5L05_10830 [Flavobacterium psychrophilum]